MTQISKNKPRYIGNVFCFVVLCCVYAQVLASCINNMEYKIVSPFDSQGGNYWSPAWSPTNSYLAFIYSQNGNYDLWVIKMDDNSVYNIVSHVSLTQNIQWIDESTLAFVSNDSLFKIDVETRALEKLFDGTDEWNSFAFDPTNPSRILISQSEYYLTRNAHPADLYEIDLNTQITRQITSTPDISEENVDISKDGRSIIYISIEDRDLASHRMGDVSIGLSSFNGLTSNINVPIVAGAHHLDFYNNYQGFVYRARYDGVSHNDAGIFYMKLDGTGEPVNLLTHSDMPDGISQFTWSPLTNQFAITTVGTPLGNDLIITQPIILP